MLSNKRPHAYMSFGPALEYRSERSTTVEYFPFLKGTTECTALCSTSIYNHRCFHHGTNQKMIEELKSRFPTAGRYLLWKTACVDCRESMPRGPSNENRRQVFGAFYMRLDSEREKVKAGLSTTQGRIECATIGKNQHEVLRPLVLWLFGGKCAFCRVVRTQMGICVSWRALPAGGAQ